MNDKFERIWKEVIMAYFKMLSQYLPGGSEENHKNPHSGQDLNPGLPKHKAGVLTT
jgi:hypothetical protein